MSNNPIPRPPKVSNFQHVRLERFPQTRAVLADLEAREPVGGALQDAGAPTKLQTLLEQARQAFGGTR